MNKKQTSNNTETQALNISVVSRSFIKRYKKIIQSKWFNQSYENISIGDSLNHT